MWIKEIKLTNFRCYSQKTFEFKEGLNVITGLNATGKTTIVEAIYMLGLSKSSRTNYDEDIIKEGQSEYAVKGLISSKKRQDIVILLNSNNRKKIIKNNETYKTLSQYVGFMPIVLSSVNDEKIFTSSPASRRNFIDIMICQISKEYLLTLSQYKKELKNRNYLLKELKYDNNEKKNYLLEVIIKKMVILQENIEKTRRKFITKINELSKIKHNYLSDCKEDIQINYIPSIDENKSIEKWQRDLKSDKETGTTTSGIHKDDYIFIINNKNIATQGSQGQQKTLALSMKLAFVDIVYQVKNEFPIVLLDDIFSELDQSRQNKLIKSLNNETQTIITSATLADINQDLLDKANIIKL